MFLSALTCSRKDFPPLNATTNQGESPSVDPGHGAVGIEPVACSRKSQRWRRAGACTVVVETESVVAEHEQNQAAIDSK
ncbi:hypothetical protein C1H46_032376 [Malus baccata]|uniref:Uncharacterized protein n=1 Tax=Malus baccata TaxID=106549 RepID=A0A540L6G7_MALBA|nr:hypothetical protein C1H46_032376 [Malus baccata]